MERNDIAEQSKWDLTHIFKTLDDWTSPFFNQTKISVDILKDIL